MDRVNVDPVTGCNKISPGCKNCYAERMSKRLNAMGQSNYRNGFRLTLQPHMLELPLKWKKPQTIFVNSMSDLFHKNVPLEYIQGVFDVMKRAHWHRFQVLTKRADRLEQVSSRLNWTPNIWMGVLVESEKYVVADRSLAAYRSSYQIPFARTITWPLRNLDLSGIDWAIVGGESGFGARPMLVNWVTDIRKQCQDANVAFFFKQWGGVEKKRNGRVLEGRTWDEMPRSDRQRLVA